MQFEKKAFSCRYISTIIVLWFAVVQLGAQSDGSTAGKVNFSGTHITLGKAMSEIEAQTGYSFAFNMDKVNTGTPVRFTEQELTLQEAFRQMFEKEGITYVTRGRFIALSVFDPVAARANVVARARDDHSLTADVYSPTDPNKADTASGIRPEAETEVEAYEIERIVTLIPAEPVHRDYPASYSDYRPVSSYGFTDSRLPGVAVKTNLLYAAAALTPNLGIEIGTNLRQSFEISGSYSWRGRNKAASDHHKQSAHCAVKPEYRWWMCERFDGHFLGAHALFSRYYISGYTVPLLFDKKYSYDGWAVGAGITYGYNVALGRQWGVEFQLGAGYAYLRYDKGSCVKCDPQPETKSKHYIGPTRAGINLVYLIR